MAGRGVIDVLSRTEREAAVDFHQDLTCTLERKGSLPLHTDHVSAFCSCSSNQDVGSEPFLILTIITRSRPHEHWLRGCGQLDSGLPGFLTRSMNLSKCSHFVDRWPRIQGSLWRWSALFEQKCEKQSSVSY